MSRVIAAVHFNFMGFFKNARTMVTLLLSVVVCFLLSGRVVEVVAYYGSSTQAAEPFIWTFGDANSVLLVSLLLIFLFSDLPKLSPFTPFYLVRMTKKQWLAAQLLYIILVTLLYVGVVMAATILLCMKHSFIGNLWSETAAILGYSNVGAELKVPSTVKVMESISPYGCMLKVVLLMLGYSLTLGFLVLFGNLVFGGKYGMILAAAYSIYGFLLNPEVIGKLLGYEDYQMYRVRSLVGWISPLNHAVYGMHDFGYDNLPTIWESMGIFGALLFLMCIFSYKGLQRYNFSFLGS